MQSTGNGLKNQRFFLSFDYFFERANNLSQPGWANTFCCFVYFLFCILYFVCLTLFIRCCCCCVVFFFSPFRPPLCVLCVRKRIGVGRGDTHTHFNWAKRKKKLKVSQRQARQLTILYYNFLFRVFLFPFAGGRVGFRDWTAIASMANSLFFIFIVALSPITIIIKRKKTKTKRNERIYCTLVIGKDASTAFASGSKKKPNKTKQNKNKKMRSVGKSCWNKSFQQITQPSTL